MSATLQVSDRRALPHSTRDALLIVLSLAHGAMLLSLPSAPVIAIALWWNANTISHNFAHLPFFRSAFLNRCSSIYLSIVLGFPQSAWRDRHIAHHAGRAHRIRFAPEVLLEGGVIVGLWSFLIFQYPQFLWGAYLPGYCSGLGLCYLHGYFEHVGGATSHYGLLYNNLFFNDGFHAEHHVNPTTHWTELPRHPHRNAKVSAWPPILRWAEFINLDSLEHLVVRSRALQKFMLWTHERALRKLLPLLGQPKTVKIVGGGIHPRTAILIKRLLPGADITIIEADAESIKICGRFLDGSVKVIHETFDTTRTDDSDLVIIPLSFSGDRGAVYINPPARRLLIHDWIWSKKGYSVVVSRLLLKRINLVERKC